MNKKKYIKDSVNARQRFSIRKLTIGTASVLLGTVFYLGTSQATVKAANTDANEKEVQTVNSSPISKNNMTEIGQTSENSSDSSVVQTKDTKVVQTSVNSKVDKPGVQATEGTVNKREDKSAKAENILQNTQTLDTLKTVPTNTNHLTESKAENRYTNLTVDKDKVGVSKNSEYSSNASDNTLIGLQSDINNENLQVEASLSGTEYNPSQNKTIQMTLQVSNNKAGDRFRVHFESGAYMVTPTALPAAFGTMDKVQNSDGSYDVIYSLTKNATINQTISIGFLNEAVAKALPYNAGSELKNIQVYYNEESQPVKTLTFNQIVVPQINPKWYRLSPSSKAVKKLFPNYDYEWQLNLGQKTGIDGSYSSSGTSGPSPLINHETTITIPVPETFVLNSEKTIAQNSSLATFTQAGKGKDVIVKLANAMPSSSFIYLWGHFDMDQPIEDTTISGSKEIVVSEDVGTSQPLIGNAGIFKEIIQGSNTHMPDGEALQGYIGGAYNGYDGPYKEGQIPYTVSHKEIVLYNYSVGNLQARPVDNVHLKITVPDGVTATKLVGTGIKEYGYQINYIDNSVKSGTVSNGESVPIENGTNISDIVLTIPKLEIDSLNPVGFTWGQGIDAGFSLYGFVSDNYRDGKKVNLGDTLNSALYPYFDAPSKNGYYNASQSVVAEQKDSININFKTTNYSYEPGKFGGNVSVSGWYAKKAVDPIFYFVVPANGEASIPLSSFKFGENQPKVSSFLVNGYQVVKVDYTGIKSTGGDIVLNIKNLPDSSSVTTNNGHVYLYAPSNIVKDYSLNEYSTVKDSDLKYVEGKTAAIDLGSFNWITQLGQGLTSVELAQGNEDGNLELSGKSDDKKSEAMTYTVSVINGQKYDIKNAHALINLPADSSTSFNFVLNENNPVKIIDLNTQQVVAGKVSYYSNFADLKNHTVTGLVDNAKNAKSILVDIDNIPANHSYRIVLSGIDPTLGYDAGKTGILSSVIWSNHTQSLKALSIDLSSDNASRITVSGNSIVKVVFKYKDSTGKDIYVQADTLKLNNNQDKLSYREKNVLDNLKRLQDKKEIPEDYVVKDASKPQEIINSEHGDYSSGIKNEKAEFNQTVKVYFDGDTLVYDLVPNIQTAILRFYDDTDNKFIEATPNIKVTDKSNRDINFEIPASYDFSKYQFMMVAKGNDPTQTYPRLDGNQLSEVNYGKFDNDINQDQFFIAHFTHKIAPIKDTKTITETVHYIYENGKTASPDLAGTPVIFTRDGEHDEVTNEDNWKNWTTEKDSFDEVKSPIISGYTPDLATVEKITVKPEDSDIVKTVTYKADDQKIIVNYIDDTTGKTLSTKELDGKSDENSGYTTKDSIDGYKAQHYDLVSDDTKGAELIFDHDDNADQVYNVHLTHHMTPINDKKTINETIHYVYEDGKTASPDVAGTPVIFTRDGKHDEVTSEDNWNDWTTEKDSFDEVKSPTISGYTPDLAAVEKITVKPEDSDIVKTVTYKADDQKAKLRFYDDTDHNFIELAPDINTIGKSVESINFDIPYDFSNYNFIEVDSANDPTDKSQKLSGDTLDKVDYGNFDKDKDTDQVFIAHFIHKTAPVKDTKVVTETIHYVYEDGTKAHDDVEQEVTFTKTGTKDLVTGEETSSWNGPQVIDEVLSPEIAGYTPDQEKINSITVSHDSTDIEKTVTYKANPQKITVNYIDDMTGKTLSTKELNGKSDENSGYTTESSIDGYKAQHYDLVSDDTNGDELVFDHDDKVDQVYNVHLTHHMTPINDTKTINETIHYVYEDGKTASPDVAGTPVIFTRDGQRDEVTKENKWNDWTTEKDNFDLVQSPEVAGYTPNVDAVPEIKVEPTDSDVIRTVTYRADDQKAKLRFYDDTDQKFIEFAPDINATGKSVESINFDIPYDFSNYSFIEVDSSNDPADNSEKLNGNSLDKVNYGNFDKDKTTDQIFIAHFTHRTESVKDTKTVVETIHYVYEDGTKAHDDVQKEVTFTKTGTKDLVTGDEKSSWSDPQEFEEVVSPKISGYTPDQEKIDPVTVSHDSKDIVKTVTYKANPQKIIVNYIDDTTGKTLSTKELNGKSNENSGYTTEGSIHDYKAQHYDLVSDDTNGGELVFDHDDKVDQVYNVHLTHHMTPINDTKTINETVHYIYEDGKTASPDVAGTPVVFTRDGQRDEVTNEDNWNDWTSEKNNFDEVKSPEIVGYTPNVDAIPEIMVKPTDSDIVRTITYKADDQKAKLRFYDDTDQKFIELAPDINATGKSVESINFDIPYDFSNYNFIEVDSGNDPVDKTNKLSGNTLDKVNYGNFDKDKNADQVFIAHFIHKTEPVTDTKVVTETVHYVYEDGTKAHDDVQKEVTFTKTGTKDLVTGEEKSSWSNPQVFEEVISPEISNYIPDKEKISSETVSHDSNDIERIVTYKAKPVEPEKPTKPEEPTTPDKPVEPEKPTKPEEPTTPDKPVEPEKPTQPEEPTTPAKPVEPEKPTKPEEPTTPDKPVEPEKPTQPEEPTTPAKPVEPEKPTQPEEPTTPAKPVEPEKPTKPEEPTTPDKPVEPEKPAQPEEPTTPAKPVEPEKPTKPKEPTTPDKPVEPEKPTQPEEPTTPAKPVEPEKPAQPEEPTTPAKPVEPEKPAQPEEPTTPAKPIETQPPKMPEQVDKLDDSKNTGTSRISTIKISRNTPVAKRINRAKTLPQTGSRNTDLSLAGLALASAGALIGLIGSKERKRRKR